MKIVFNSSLPRSGSTLLQNILAQNPRFHCTPTSGLFDLLFAAREQFTRLPEVQAQDREVMKKAFLGYCSGAIEGFLGGITDRPVCVDKSRGWIREYDWLSTFHPNPKVLVCVRDLRAILSSMEKKWLKNPHYHRPELGADPTGMKMANIQGRITQWLNSVPVGTAVTHLLGLVEQGKHSRLHIVRFEELTTQPQQVLDGIYDYLEEPRFTHDFANVEQRTHENDALHSIYGDHIIRSEVKPVPPDYHETLGKALSNTIKQDNSVFYSTFYPGR
jgi:sulfotransferase